MEVMEPRHGSEEPEDFDTSDGITTKSFRKDRNTIKKTKSHMKTKRGRRPGSKPKSAVDNGLMLKTFLPDSTTSQTFRTHRCHKCNRCFKMRSHLQEHLNLHFPDPNLQCPTCKRHFTSKSKLQIHQLREAGLKSYQCDLCQYSAVEPNALRRHFRTVHGDKNEQSTDLNFSCPVCRESFCQSKSLKIHMKAHNIVKSMALLSCVEDGCSFKSSLYLLLKHITETHDFTPIECQHHSCVAIFKTAKLMKEHYKTHQAYHCTDCDFSCSNKRLFMQHCRQGHVGGEQLSCEFCDFKTFNSVEFERHVEHLHASEKIHKCPQCDYTTAHKRGLRRHILMHSGEKPHKCSVCEFRCREEWSLSRHMLTHSSSKNHMCSECGYVTKWKHYLTVHMRKHTGDRKYHCDQCTYHCYRADQLSSHKLRHQEKSLICEVCGYSCKRKYELRQHMLSKHSETDRPAAIHQCKYCPYTTSYRQALRNHENCKHTKAREFTCALCSYTSFSSISLFLHKRKSHGYVPGDKAWLHNYALKEKEQNMKEKVNDFYNQATAGNAANTKEPSAKVDSISDVNIVSKETTDEEVCPNNATSGSATKANVQLESPRVDSICDFNVVGQEETLVGPNEEYCTLVLTTLTGDEVETTTSRENRKNVRDVGGDCHSLITKNGLLSTWSSEGEETATEQSDLDEANEIGLIAEFENSSEGRSTVLQEEQCTKDLKELDKMQSASMVLDGHVEMVMVPSTRTSSGVRKKTRSIPSFREGKRFSCQNCGAEFKGKRSLDNHIKSKCPPMQTETNLAIGDSCVEGQIDQTVIECSSDFRVKSHNEAESPKTSDLEQNRQSWPSPAQGTVSHEEPCAYVEVNNKFQCEQCGFSAARLVTMERHTATCRTTSSKNINKSIGGTVNAECSQKKMLGRKTTAMKKHNCRECEFVAKSTVSLIRHEVLAHQKNSFNCERCGFSCKQERRLLQHVAVKHKKSKNPLQCRFCSFSTKRNYRLEEHESVHTGVGRHRCEICQKTFGALSKLRKHKSRLHDKEATHFCTKCDFAGFSRDDIKRHKFRCHTGDMKFDCAHCGAKFSSHIALRNHCKRAHQRTLPCKECDFFCYSSSELDEHQNSKHKAKGTVFNNLSMSEHMGGNAKSLHACQLCQFSARTQKVLAQHLSKEHEGGSEDTKSLKCSHCGFKCQHQLVLEQHLRTHGGKRLYKCTRCEYSSANKQKMTWHVRTHTGDKPYSCEECSYTCTEPSRLKQHMRVHQEEKKYLCPECGYKCKWATQLKLHMTKHTGEKRFSCPDCDYRSSRADALRSHRETQHTSSRPFVCENCGKSFKTAFVLRTHQQQHSDARPYSCGLCQKAFKWPAGLRHHFLSHTQQTPFRCRVCSYRAKQRFQVIKHLKKHHPEVRAEEGVERDGGVGGLTIKEALDGAVAEK